MKLRTTLKAALAATALALPLSGTASADDTLRVVMHSDLKIVDPIWTTAYMSRNYGYMVYDTLFALDDKLAVQNQMVESVTISDDKLTYLIKLRGGLKWHDGAEVTAEDIIASIKRWGDKDSFGQQLTEFTADMQPLAKDTVRLTLKEPYGLVLAALSKPSSNVPFMMPARVAATPSGEQIKRSTSAPARSSSRKTNGSRVIARCSPRTAPTSRAPSPPAGWPAARSSRSTASSGFPCPTIRPR